MALNPVEVAQLNGSVKALLEIWLRIKLALQKAFSKGELSREQENAFLQLKSDLSRTYRQIAERLPKDLAFDGDLMIEMMKNAISMQHLQNQAVNDKRNMFTAWHKIYVKMTRTYGALEVIDQGYYPSIHRDLLKSTKPAAKTGKPGKAKSKK